ncbi:DNA-deoxyinosine glycosylase [Pseudoduganella sp. RAF53_2]|uniref:DNA-deoxyinosine glycosylase n=1 Tax=unclassified Pseudoduganella TaxID=2637179 RepID=UPI003F98D833
MSLKRCFDPVVNQHTRILLLGSLPSEKSLVLQQYYGNPQNRFWHLVGEVIGVDLVPLDYQTRLSRLLHHGVGLWDVVASARRSGSLDSQIRDQAGNDIAALAASLPKLNAIGFNGGTAARHGLKQLGALAERYRIVVLPSSSPAHTLAYDKKLEAWMGLKDYVG